MSQQTHLPHPGEILDEEFIKPMGLSVKTVAKDIFVGQAHMHRLVKGESNITANLALRLSKLFGTSKEFWMSLQSQYDLSVAEKAHANDLRKIQPRARPET